MARCIVGADVDIHRAIAIHTLQRVGHKVQHDLPNLLWIDRRNHGLRCIDPDRLAAILADLADHHDDIVEPVRPGRWERGELR